MTDELPPRLTDSRADARRRLLIAGKLMSRDDSSSIDCSVHDVSDTGARVTVKGERVVPRHVRFTHSRTDLVFEAEVTWARPPQYGLRFIRALRPD